jgi:hypothetical protein
VWEGKWGREKEEGKARRILTLDEVFSLRALLESFLQAIRYFLALQLVSCCLECPKSLSAYHPACLHLSSLLRYWKWGRTAQHYYLTGYASRATPSGPVGAADVSLTNSDGREKARGRARWGSRRWRTCGVLLTSLLLNPFYLLLFVGLVLERAVGD